MEDQLKSTENTYLGAAIRSGKTEKSHFGRRMAQNERFCCWVTGKAEDGWAKTGICGVTRTFLRKWLGTLLNQAHVNTSLLNGSESERDQGPCWVRKVPDKLHVVAIAEWGLAT